MGRPPTRLTVEQGDITTCRVDAIVNAANPSLMGGGGVDGAIHRAGGPAILEDCRAVVARQGSCPPGEAVVTGPGELPAGLVIHTVGPVWSDDRATEHDRTLASAYRASLDRAAEHHVRTIAFPNISTGVYGFPKARAARVAINACLDWLEAEPEHAIEAIAFVCFDDENLALYRALLEG